MPLLYKDNPRRPCPYCKTNILIWKDSSGNIKGRKSNKPRIFCNISCKNAFFKSKRVEKVVKIKEKSALRVLHENFVRDLEQKEGAMQSLMNRRYSI